MNTVGMEKTAKVTGSDLRADDVQVISKESVSKESVSKDAVEMIRWPSIELFHNLRRSLMAAEVTPTLTYRTKIKLDGTNGAVQVLPSGKVVAQSRSQIITPENDNAGFATWVDKNKDRFATCAKDEHVTIFGEWCGKGIQKRTAISEIDRKIFTVFAVRLADVSRDSCRWVIEPDEISRYVPEHVDVYVLPFFGAEIVLDFADEEGLKGAIAHLNQTISEVENLDPWVKATFGIEGIGEGLVLYPDPDNTVERRSYSDLLFKAKGLKHQVVKTKKPVQVDPEKAESIDEFVSLFVTSNRCKQGVAEGCSGKLEMPQTGNFLKWVCMDVQKESKAELEVAGLTWKDVSKAVGKAAREWYITKVQSF
ncbi:MAG: RNA ligase family protein [Cyanobacteria bacterium J06621_11]